MRCGVRMKSPPDTVIPATGKSQFRIVLGPPPDGRDLSIQVEIARPNHAHGEMYGLRDILLHPRKEKRQMLPFARLSGDPFAGSAIPASRLR